MAKVDNTTDVKVTVNEVKPQIYFVKRRLHNYLVKGDIAAKTSTTSKPEVKNGLTTKQHEEVKTVVTNLLQEMTKTYKQMTKPQVDYVTNHMVNVHTDKYLVK